MTAPSDEGNEKFIAIPLKSNIQKERGMQYHSTRGGGETVSAKEAILQGLCSDGGLFVSDSLPETKLDVLTLCQKTYSDIALAVFEALLPDYSRQELEESIALAYGGKFETEPLTPVTAIGEDWLLELYHGPTAAFKDMALCMLPQLMSRALQGKREKLMVVTATSGDTGKAALSGFQDAKDIGITVFYPEGKVSDIQYLQMATQRGENVSVCAVRGNFDDCQSGVKELFASGTAKALQTEGIPLSSANSINVGRLVPQIVYYIDAYGQLFQKGRISLGDPVDFCVPTGNFGDILAGYYAKLLGLPVRRLIVASNENNVLTDFLTTGTYDRNRSFVKTISPSMDILISSNLERMLYYMAEKDSAYVAARMQELQEIGRFTVSRELLNKIRATFDCGYATNEASRVAIRKAFEQTGRLIDPHTAVAWKVMQDRKLGDGVPAVILSTASPYKFAKDVYLSIFQKALPQNADGFAYMDALFERSCEPVPASLSRLKGKPILHRDCIDRSEIGAYVKAQAEAYLKK